MRSLSVASSTEAPREAHGASSARGLLRLDLRLAAHRASDPAASPLLVVRSERGAAHAIAEHVRRRLSLAGAEVIVTTGGEGTQPFCALLARRTPSQRKPDLAPTTPRSSKRSPSAREVATELASRLALTPALAFVVLDPEPGAFSSTVASELEALVRESPGPGSPHAVRVVWIVAKTAASVASAGFEPSVVEIDGELSEEDARSWWDAAARCHAEGGPASSRTVGARSLADLERWWTVARQAEPSRIALTADARALHLALTYVGRPVSVEHVRSLLGAAHAALLADSHDKPCELAASATSELVRAGLVAVLSEPDSSGESIPVVALIGEGSAQTSVDLAAHDHARRCAAHVLELAFPTDAWALARAAELTYARLGSEPVGPRDPGDRERELDHADALFERAITSVIDPDARADFWVRFRSTMHVSLLDGAPMQRRLVELATLALSTGDVEVAVRMARDAVAADPTVDAPAGGAARLIMGRALAATGDLTAAGLTLLDVATRSGADDPRPWIELAEVRYWTGDLTGAREAASRAADHAVPAHRVDARNVLGKLLLSAGDFAAAELHFATDACHASLAGLFVAELRARVNRAIAVLSLGRRSEALSLLESVLVDAEARGELKAAGLALVNMAPIAILDHRYGDALAISERAVTVLRRIGDRLALAKCIANLADLRVRIGLVDEASQALRFGGRVFKGAAPREQAAHFSLVWARVHLARGDTSQARQAVAQAFASLGCAADSAAAPGDDVARGPSHELLSQGLRLGVRIALEEGDLTHARGLLDRARSERAPIRARAEVALLDAAIARALGEPSLALAQDALDSCRDADEDELLREAHVLMSHALAAGGDRAGADRAVSHLKAAMAVCDRVARGLPDGLRAGYLARRDVLEIDALLASSSRRSLLAPLPDGVDRAHVEPGGLDSAGVDAVRPSQPRAGAASTRTSRMVGSDPAIRALLSAIRKVGASDATVLIHGESGTGKELVAEAVHEASARRAGPLVKVNCGALVETLLLSELFGHEKGAFTGAAARRRGRFEAAEGGTLFLDEIGDISARTQVALLRVLQEKTFERVGGTVAVRANVRIVCATHRDLKAMVARGEFREDLYYRLCGVGLEVPSLRARLGDLGVISDAILGQVAAERGSSVKRLSVGALGALRAYPWPGNVRELGNALRAASLFAESDTLEIEDFTNNINHLRFLTEDPVTSSTAPRALASLRPALTSSPDTLRGTGVAAPAAVTAGSSAIAPSTEPASEVGSPSGVAYARVRAGTSLHDMKRMIERDCIERALSDAEGNITRAAVLLGMKRPRLSQLVKQYGLGAVGDDALQGDCDGDEEAV